MLDGIVVHLIATVPALTAAYWICMIVGAGMLLISTFAGGDADADLGGDLGGDLSVDADVSADADLSVDGDVDTGHTHPAALANWFSMQFVVFFMAAFGFIGVVLTHLTGHNWGVVFGGAMVGGLVVGQGAHQVLRKLRQASGDSTPQPRDYINKAARVTVSITPPARGEVALRVGRAERFVPAVSRRSDTTFKPGEQVAVIGYHGGVAEVVSREEYEFLTDKGKSADQTEGGQA